MSTSQIGGDQYRDCTMNIQSSVESVGEIGRDILWRWRQVAITSPGQLNTEWMLRLENEILGSICLLVTRNSAIKCVFPLCKYIVKGWEPWPMVQLEEMLIPLKMACCL